MTESKHTKRVGAYARVSTPDQNAENQIDQIRRFCKARGWEIVHEFAREHGYFISGWAINEDRGIVGILFDNYQFSTKTNNMALKFYRLDGELIAETSFAIEGSRINTSSRENFIIYNKGRNFAFGLKNKVYGGGIP